MSHLIFLLEEPSMKEFLDVFLPKVLPEEITYETIPFRGKHDLEKAIPRKIKSFNVPEVQFIVVRDRDSSDCIQLKAKLCGMCTDAGRGDALVRIVCNELESWFLGDLAAVEQAYQKKGLTKLQDKVKFRDPDHLNNSFQELKALLPDYQKTEGARRIAEFMNPQRNRSTSFQVFLAGVLRMVDATKSVG